MRPTFICCDEGSAPMVAMKRHQCWRAAQDKVDQAVSLANFSSGSFVDNGDNLQAPAYHVNTAGGCKIRAAR